MKKVFMIISIKQVSFKHVSFMSINGSLDKGKDIPTILQFKYR